MTDYSDKEFRFGYWVFLRRDLFRKILIGFLIIVAAGSVGYALVRLISYVATSRAYDQMIVSLTQNNPDYAAWHEKIKPLDINIISVVTIPVGKTYDLVAQVKNSNLRWAASALNYSFESNGKVLGQAQSFLLPMEEKFLTLANVELDNPQSIPSITFSEIRWERIRDLNNFPILNFTVTNQQVDDLYTLTDGKKEGTRLEFDLTNRSPYSFWDVKVTAVLVSGTSVRAVGSQWIHSFDSNQKVNLRIDWPETVFGLTNVIIKPEINVLDSSAFKLK